MWMIRVRDKNGNVLYRGDDLMHAVEACISHVIGELRNGNKALLDDYMVYLANRGYKGKKIDSHKSERLQRAWAEGWLARHWVWSYGGDEVAESNNNVQTQ